jgi:predicted aspartyl protease
MMRALILAAAFAALSLPAFADSADSVIAANKAAMGGAAWDAKQSMTADYAYSGQGMTGTVHSVSDMTTPRFADSYAIGPATGGNGFDGNRAWNQDASGQVTYQDGGEQRQIAINDAYRRANLLWKPGRGGAEVTAAARTQDGRSYDVLTVTPRDGKPFEIWIDRETHMTARVVEKQAGDTYTTVLSDYRAIDGVQVPHKTVTGNGTPKYDTTLTLTKAAFGGALPAETFAIPAVTKLDFSIRGGGRQTTVPFVLVNNHIYADVYLNGKGPYRMLVDTGGVNIVTPTIARALGLTVEGQIEGRGAGEGRVDVSLTKVAEVRVGDAIIKDQVFAVFPFFETFDVVEGVPQNGLIGYEVFRRFVARVDYGRGELTLIDPRQFQPEGSGIEVPFVFTGHVPTVKGEIDGIAGDFQIDTGARSELTLTDPFATAHKLRAEYPRGVDTVAGWGVGGPSRGYVTRMRMLRIGKVEFSEPVVAFASEKRGAFGEASFAGNVGGGLLKQYVVTFDYEHQKMYFAPGGIAERDGYDRVGIWINRAPQGFQVMDVTATSPAAIAGLKAGDVIYSLDGKRATDFALPDVRRWFRTQKPGTVIHFGVLRAGKTIDLAVTLRDMV